MPLILMSILAPVWIIIVSLMLGSPRGLAKAAAFVAGMTAIRLVQGGLFGAMLQETPAAQADNGDMSPVESTLLLVVGILLLVTAVRKWRKDVDPDEPPPKWMASIQQLPPLRAFGMGVLLVAIGPKQWVFTLSALSIISAEDLGRWNAIASYILYIFLAQIVVVLAVLAYAVRPAAASATLQQGISWLDRNSRPIGVGASLIFGVYFAWKGVSGLMV